MFPLVGARRPKISVNLIKDNRLKYAKDLNPKTGIWYTDTILPKQSQERERDREREAEKPWIAPRFA